MSGPKDPIRPAFEPELRVQLLRLGRRSSIFLGWWLARVPVARGQSFEEQAAALGLSLNELTFLGLCGLPRPERWRADVRTIAERVGMDPGRLEDLLLEAAAVASEP